jgi:paraquat-inducible protein B
MNEYPDKPEAQDPEAARARVHLAKWSPWVWLIPVAAIFFVGWLVIRYGFMGGGDITVHFTEAGGLERYSPVRFRGAKVGTVQKITVDKDLKEVVVRISMDASMTGALRKGTRFWIVEPGLSGSGIGGLLSGTYVAIAPGDGDESSEFVGQEYPPVLSAPEAGKTFILETNGLGSVEVGAPVEFKGIRVGRVLGTEFNEKTGVTSVHAFVVQRFANDVRQSTRFWRGGGLDVSLAGGGLSLKGVSLASLLGAPISFYTPSVLAGPSAAAGTHFELFENQGAAEAAADGPHLSYLTYFPGSVHGLIAGTPVTMKGVQVGRVREVRLRYLPATASLETPVTLEIDPRLLEFPVNNSTTRDDLRRAMDDALAQMVRKGMRATLATSLVLPGASAVALETTAKAGSGRLVVENDPPIIPAASAGSGLEGALGAINGIAGRINNLPIEEIAGHLRSTSQRLDSLVHDPALDQSLQRLNRSLADVERVAATARENVGPIASSVRNAAASAESAAKKVDANVEPIVQSLRNTAASAEEAAKRAQALMGSSPRQNYDLGELIKELTRAAESVRALASYLSENPDALLKGRRE